MSNLTEDRKKNNRVLVKFLEHILTEHPEMRFFQVIVGMMMNNQRGALDINRFYYEQSHMSLKRIEKFLVDSEYNQYIDILNKLKEKYL